MKSGFFLFETTIGTCGIAWNEKGINYFGFPEKSVTELSEKIRKCSQTEETKKPPAFIKGIIDRIHKHLDGKFDDFLDLEIDLEGYSDFYKEIYNNLRKVLPGKTVTYAELAEKSGKPGAARAVGTAMGKNPVGFLIPCHRVLSAGNMLGGFSAHGGAKLKAYLLSIEGAFPNLYKNRKKGEIETGVEYLCSRDKKFSRLVESFGPFKVEIDHEQSIFDALFDSIISQQLSGKAASTISARVRTAVQKGKRILPEHILKATDEKLRECGLSRAKTAALRDLSEKTLMKQIPDFQELSNMENEKIIEILTKVKGIGPWTVEMLLIFRLGHLDVWPVNDLGVRKGLSIYLRLKELPTPAETAEFGMKWKPYRTIAAWYFWRLAEKGELKK
ncbi:MAG: methylated-DNA--[protein]-cysteine S-methyltransferase [Candidatus Riflebacteria bacterium]|nr:methylated-DNA--[protein]-cysteine S-methyltransferase [Candidatus Riflebacteria bacterium]